MSAIKSVFKNFFGIRKYEDLDLNNDDNNPPPAKKEKVVNEHKVNLCPIVNPIQKTSVKVAYNLQELLSNLTTEQFLKDVVDRNLYLLVKSDDAIVKLGIMGHPQGFLVNEFQNFLSSRKEFSEESRKQNVQKLNFLVMAEIVIRLCKNVESQRQVFDYWVSNFLNKINNPGSFIKLKLVDLADDVQDGVKDSEITEYVTKAKEDVNIWSECLAPLYDRQFINSDQFHELKKKNTFVACLLSIL